MRSSDACWGPQRCTGPPSPIERLGRFWDQQISRYAQSLPQSTDLIHRQVPLTSKELRHSALASHDVRQVGSAHAFLLEHEVDRCLGGRILNGKSLPFIELNQ